MTQFTALKQIAMIVLPLAPPVQIMAILLALTPAVVAPVTIKTKVVVMDIALRLISG